MMFIDGFGRKWLVMGFDEKNTWVLIGKPFVLMGGSMGFTRKFHF